MLSRLSEATTAVSIDQKGADQARNVTGTTDVKVLPASRVMSS
jgi:hypothetical protein